MFRVILAAECALLRESLVRLLAHGGFHVVAAVENLDQLLRAVADLRPDVVITEVRLPPGRGDEGLGAVMEVRRRFAQLPVLALAQDAASAQAAQPLAGGRSGVGLGYLLKDRVGHVADFLDAVWRVTAGQTVVDPQVVRSLVARHPLTRLTPAEREVLALVAEGLTDQAIAERLTLTEAAVVKHASSVFAKLDLRAAEGNRRVRAVLAYLGQASLSSAV
ncbi:LuxR C-terminal-related transcriptional regulator [Nonomuraea typhae]|uniref:LuxR C-terminal-related transcriptional regulator n=1 Tax=Nonomuraea typhae TaxID=2603600 RepID=UPI0012FB21D8|nr:response regulator transcription factor [Nonomuraea typhae]